MEEKKLNDGKNSGRDSNPENRYPGRDLNPGSLARKANILSAVQVDRARRPGLI